MEKPIYTVSVTKLETFRQYYMAPVDEDKPWVNEENLIASLRGVYQPNDKTRFGSAYHLIVEQPRKNRYWDKDAKEWYYLIDGIRISNKQAEPAWQYIKQHPNWVREVPGSKIYEAEQFKLIVTYKIDAMEGIYLRDTKCKFSNADMQEYMDSVQWRFYLDAENMDHFFFDLFQVRGYDSIADGPTCRIEALEPMHLCRYSGMNDELQSVVQAFADYIDFKGFRDLITPTPISRAAGEYGLFKDMEFTDDTIITWGKHKGVPCGSAPMQYWQWLLDQPHYSVPQNLLTYIKSKS